MLVGTCFEVPVAQQLLHKANTPHYLRSVGITELSSQNADSGFLLHPSFAFQRWSFVPKSSRAYLALTAEIEYVMMTSSCLSFVFPD
jgi:hypothetical protein